MAHHFNNPNPAPASGCGAGCLAAIGVAIAFPVLVFLGILIGNSRNPRCGTPADAGGCEIGLGSGTLSGIVIGLIAGLVVFALWNRMDRKR
jgi:hypothetical protein